MQNNSYVLGVGEQGKERLDLLNDLIKEFSQSLLFKAGLKRGQDVLEVGCGTGNMTCWLAEQVNPGRVFAIDNSAQQIELAKQQAAMKKITNITFIQTSVFELKDVPPVDLIYVRFLLMHVSQPYHVLEILLRFLKPFGFLVCEESTNSITCCYPFSTAFRQYRQLLMQLGEKKGLDYDIGEKLYSYFYKLKLKNIFVKFSQPIFQTRREKKIIPLLFAEVKDNYLKEKLASQEEINELTEELDKFIEDDSFLVSFPRMTQIYGQKT